MQGYFIFPHEHALVVLHLVICSMFFMCFSRFFKKKLIFFFLQKMNRGLISDELRKLLLSFSVDIPDDASGNSFVRDVLDDLFVHSFVSGVRSLSHGVALIRDLFPKEEALRFSPIVHVLEINIDRYPETWEEKRVISNQYLMTNYSAILSLYIT